MQLLRHRRERSASRYVCDMVCPYRRPANHRRTGAQVASMLKKAAEELNEAQAEFEYRCLLKQQHPCLHGEVGETLEQQVLQDIANEANCPSANCASARAVQQSIWVRADARLASKTCHTSGDNLCHLPSSVELCRWRWISRAQAPPQAVPQLGPIRLEPVAHRG